MVSDASYSRRKPFPHRPWIGGKLYDDLARDSILHCDAYVMDHSGFKALVIDWRQGGREQVALDAYLIADDGLTPLWNPVRMYLDGTPLTWSRGLHTWFRRVHATVIAEAAKAQASGRWGRVSVQAHYVDVREADVEIAENRYNAPKAYTRNNSLLPDIL